MCSRRRQSGQIRRLIDLGLGDNALYQQAQTIGVVFHDFPLGGSERIAVRLMNRWAQTGRAVVALCGARRGPLVDLISPDVQLVECSPVIPRALGSRRRLGQALAQFLQRRPVDVLFTPGNFHWPVLPALADVPRQIRPAVVTHISTPLFRLGRGPLHQLAYTALTRHRLRHVDAAVALSPLTVGHADRVLGRNITECIRLPVLDECEAGTALSPARGDLIVAAGRLVKEKGFDVALHALARMQHSTAQLAILGEGPQEGALRALAARLGIAHRVHFAGYVRNIAPWLEQSRVFLLSSFYEGYAAVIVEALAAGRPVVSTDCTPATADLLDGLPGCESTPIGDAGAMADSLDRVMTRSIPDPSLLAGVVEGYRIGPIADKHLALFDSVVARRESSVPAPESAEGVAYV